MGQVLDSFTYRFMDSCNWSNYYCDFPGGIQVFLISARIIYLERGKIGLALFFPS